MAQNIDELVAECNKVFKSKGIKIQAAKRGGKIVLRGIFPAKDGSGVPKQSRISTGISTGSPLHVVRKKLVSIVNTTWDELLSGEFTWDKRTGRKFMNAPRDMLEKFEDYCQENKSISTFDSAYKPYINRLRSLYSGKEIATNPFKTLSAAVNSYPPDTRSRQMARQCYTQMGRLFVDELFELRKSCECSYVPPCSEYEGQSLNIALSDETILSAYHSIPNPDWRFVFSLMATYGLRNHEVFACDFSELFRPEIEKPIIRVLGGTKTGQRTVLPFPIDWLEEMNMRNPENRLPNVSIEGRTPQRLGQHITRQFSRYSVPFKPYDLRHNHIVRMTCDSGVPIPVAAKLGGHGPMVMLRTYHRVLSRDRARVIASRCDEVAG
jgi:integrase